MTNVTILELQDFMGETHERIETIMRYISTAEKTRPLDEKEQALKRNCSQMRSLTADTMQMLDEDMGGDA